MKKTCCLLLFFYLSINISFAQNFWSKIDSPTGNDLNTLFFMDSLRGWIGGDSGLILYTSDSGISWIQQQSNTDRNIIDLYFLDENLGWAIGWTEGILPFVTYILKTTNGGIQWSVDEFRQQDILMFAIHFQDSLKGFMGGNPGGIFKTTDGGINWDSASIAPAPFAYFPILGFSFYSDDYGFACGGAHDIAGVTWKTTDGGDYWEPINNLYTPPDELWDFHFFDSTHAIGVGGDPELFGVGILRTTDAGITWGYNEIGLIGMARAIAFRTENDGWAPVPGPESLIHTEDYGYTWTTYIAPDSSRIYDMVFSDTLIGFAVGEMGTILKYKYPIIPSVEVEKSVDIENYVLFQNYPNPFNPSTTIKYSLATENHVSITVYDVLGIEVEKLVDSYQSPGNYSVNWNAENLPSGIYYYKLNTVDFSGTKKMVLLR